VSEYDDWRCASNFRLGEEPSKPDAHSAEISETRSTQRKLRGFTAIEKLDRRSSAECESVLHYTRDFRTGTIGVSHVEDRIAAHSSLATVDHFDGFWRNRNILDARFAREHVARPDLDTISDCKRSNQRGNADDHTGCR
jgi:hypothetical protein